MVCERDLANNTFENVAKFKCYETTQSDQNYIYSRPSSYNRPSSILCYVTSAVDESSLKKQP
jgi:hypothetical protein